MLKLARRTSISFGIAVVALLLLMLAWVDSEVGANTYLAVQRQLSEAERLEVTTSTSDVVVLASNISIVDTLLHSAVIAGKRVRSTCIKLDGLEWVVGSDSVKSVLVAFPIGTGIAESGDLAAAIANRSTVLVFLARLPALPLPSSVTILPGLPGPTVEVRYRLNNAPHQFSRGIRAITSSEKDEWLGRVRKIAQSQTVEGLTGQSNLVVHARVVSFEVQPGESASQLLGYRIQIIRGLGQSASGSYSPFVYSLLPRNWKPGETYLLFLRHRHGDIFEVIPGRPNEPMEIVESRLLPSGKPLDAVWGVIETTWRSRSTRQ